MKKQKYKCLKASFKKFSEKVPIKSSKLVTKYKMLLNCIKDQMIISGPNVKTMKEEQMFYNITECMLFIWYTRWMIQKKIFMPFLYYLSDPQLQRKTRKLMCLWYLSSKVICFNPKIIFLKIVNFVFLADKHYCFFFYFCKLTSSSRWHLFCNRFPPIKLYGMTNWQMY